MIYSDGGFDRGEQFLRLIRSDSVSSTILELNRYGVESRGTINPPTRQPPYAPPGIPWETNDFRGFDFAGEEVFSKQANAEKRNIESRDTRTVIE